MADDSKIGTISFDIETMIDGSVLVYNGQGVVWQNTTFTGHSIKPKGMVENFIEHFDICGPGGANIEKILKKKHSERTEEEKENIRYLMRQDKAEKPKIEIPNDPQGAGFMWYDAVNYTLMYNNAQLGD